MISIRDKPGNVGLPSKFQRKCLACFQRKDSLSTRCLVNSLEMSYAHITKRGTVFPNVGEHAESRLDRTRRRLERRKTPGVGEKHSEKVEPIKPESCRFHSRDVTIINSTENCEPCGDGTVTRKIQRKQRGLVNVRPLKTSRKLGYDAINTFPLRSLLYSLQSTIFFFRLFFSLHIQADSPVVILCGHNAAHQRLIEIQSSDKSNVRLLEAARIAFSGSVQ